MTKFKNLIIKQVTDIIKVGTDKIKVKKIPTNMEINCSKFI